MKRVFALVSVAILSLCNLSCATRQAAQPVLLRTVKQLPVALDPDFEFRKTNLFLIAEQAPETRQTKKNKKARSGDFTSSKRPPSAAQAASITFERQYRLFGAVTGLDQRQRFGNYFDFFWRVKRPAAVTVRLEYRQAKLHAHVQAQEVSYEEARGSHKTEFKVVGDDYFDGGRVIAWRCLLINQGKIVAENRSFLWK
ncbi:MAG TPA: hypothetical protein VJ719_07890 [Chthoniobacterales bacterium]|nr:hypothetical protein [Chthoniobacterales bacterium]